MGVRLCRRTGTYRRGSAATKGCAEDVFGRASWVAEVAVDRWCLPTGYRTIYGQYGPVKSYLSGLQACNFILIWWYPLHPLDEWWLHIIVTNFPG